MIRVSFLTLSVICVFNVNAQITFSEIMFDLEGADYHDEFIEIFNLSESESIDLTGWYLSDSVNIDGIIDAGEGMSLVPSSYAVILDGSYFANSTLYDDIIPDSALILTIDGGAFSLNGLTNTVPKTLMLFNTDSQQVDAYRYSIDNKPGYSDEKILMKSDNSTSNWGNSLVKFGTPGFRNSISPHPYDLGLSENALTYHPSILIRTLQTVSINCEIMNMGLENFYYVIDFLIFIDTNKDSIPESEEEVILDENIDIDLIPRQTTIIQSDWTPILAGTFNLVARIESDSDQNILNNIISKKIMVVESRETVKINEIKFLTDEGEPEWLELINNGEESLSLQDWAIADLNDTCRIDTSIIMNPGDFKVIASEKTIKEKYNTDDSVLCILNDLPSFNNASETIFLLNPAGGWVEQVPYTIDWLEGEDWRKPSLERINYNLDSRVARNWGPSTHPSGATPGAKNSLFTPIKPNTLKIQVKPNPFSPDGDGFEDHTIISVKSPAEAARMRLDIYDILGRKVRTIKDNSYTGSTIDLVWDGQNDKGQKVNMGIYIIFLQILDDRNGIIKEIKESVVVAGKL